MVNGLTARSMASSTLLILPKVAKISCTCSCVTLRVSLPTCSFVLLTSAARPPSLAAGLALLPFCASDGFAAPFVSAAEAFAGSLTFAPSASLRLFAGGGDRGGLELQSAA